MDTNNGTEALNKALKYSFLPRKRNMTLTGLVGLLVDQFLPDSHQHYLFENYRQMDIYRVPANVVPSYLKGRPRTLIKHCLVRKTKSNKFTHDSIHQNDTPGSFDIIKDSGAKHTVSFALESDDQMPSCTCKDWAKAEIEMQCKSHGPKNALSIVSDKHGGIVDASSPCELPRNERQITYIKSKSTPTTSCPLADQVFAIMLSAKEEDFMGKFVRETRPSPEPAFVLARDRQLDDLVRFCTVAEEFSILTVDPTFNLGDFDVTPTTYRHCLLNSTRSGISPVLIGPTMIHYRKTFHTYLFFASTLIGLRPELQGLRAFGTDGEKSLVDAFAHEFRYAIHLTCFIHFRQNIKRKLHELQYPESTSKEILDDVFGCKQGSTFSEGLVDSNSDEEFNEKLSLLEERWKQLEVAHNIESGIYDWFLQYKASVMKTTMIKSIREEACLGIPPEPFTTNASETINSVIKVHVSYKPSQLMEFVGKLKELIDEQEREVERAVIRRGKYRLKEEYAFLEVNESDWFKMTQEQRRAHLKKVSQAAVKPKVIAKAPDPNASTSGHTPLALAADVEAVSASVGIPLSVLKGIWDKAQELLVTTNSICSAPGYPADAKMVESGSGKRPHLVVACKGGQFKCDDECLNFKLTGICSHTVAVAHLNNSLQQFISWFTKAKKKPNFTKVAVHDMPAGRGRKGTQAPRKRKKQEPVTNRIDRFSTDQTGNSSFTFNIQAATYSPYNYMYNNKPPSTSWIPSYPDWSPDSYMSPSMFPPPPPLPPPLPPPPSTLRTTPPPMAEEASPFNLCFISGNIAKCAGCNNKYIKPPTPPYDLCVQHREWRSYTPPGGDKQSKFSPAHYHVNLLCIRRNWPTFNQRELSISSEVSSKLTQVHKVFLTSLGFYV